MSDIVIETDKITKTYVSGTNEVKAPAPDARDERRLMIDFDRGALQEIELNCRAPDFGYSYRF